jgi:hypothetical protein
MKSRMKSSSQDTEQQQYLTAMRKLISNNKAVEEV